MKLPKIIAKMPTGQSCFIELYNILISKGIVTEDSAVERYIEAFQDFGTHWIDYENIVRNSK